MFWYEVSMFEKAMNCSVLMLQGANTESILLSPRFLIVKSELFHLS